MKIKYLAMSIALAYTTTLSAIGPSVNLTPIISYLLSDSSRDRSAPHVFNLAELAQNASLSPLEYLNKEFEAKAEVSFDPSVDTKLFSSYDYANGAVYTTGNWTSKFDFSGVGWDKTMAGVLITDKHIVVANHYQRGVGQTIIFHAKDGTAVVRKIAKTMSLGSYQKSTKIDDRIFDVAIAELNASVPDKIKVYSLFDSSTLEGSKLTTQIDGAPFIISNQDRKIYIEKIRHLYPYYPNSTWIVKPDGAFMINGGYNSVYSSMHGSLRNGDSGNPTFIVIEGELVLLTTFTGYEGGGYIAPFYGDREMIAYLKQAIIDISTQ